MFVFFIDFFCFEDKRSRYLLRVLSLSGNFFFLRKVVCRVVVGVNFNGFIGIVVLGR